MSRFSEELKVIPKTARIIAVIAYFVSMLVWILVLTYSHDQGLQSTPEAAKIALVFLPGVFLAFYVLLIGYVNGDARRRGMRYVMWTLLAMFIPNAIGIIPASIAKLVIKIGRRRLRAPSIAASHGSRPSIRLRSAKVTSRMAFATATPIAMIAPMKD